MSEQDEVVAAAARAYCSAALAEAPDEVMACKALFAACGATTPSQTPPTHVVVAVDELERLREDRGAERAARLKMIQMVDDVISESDLDLRDSLMIQLGASGLLAERMNP